MVDKYCVYTQYCSYEAGPFCTRNGPRIDYSRGGGHLCALVAEKAVRTILEAVSLDRLSFLPVNEGLPAPPKAVDRTLPRLCQPPAEPCATIRSHPNRQSL